MSGCPKDDIDDCIVGREFTTPVDFNNGSVDPEVPKSIGLGKATSCCSSHSHRLSLSSAGPLARRLSSLDLGDSRSVHSHHGEFKMHDVDISKNYGHGTVPVKGRESHTADLVEFDRYISLLEKIDRGREEELWKVGIMPGMLDMNGSDYESGLPEKDQINTAPPPSVISVTTERLPSSDGDEDRGPFVDPLETSHLAAYTDQSKLRFPFNNKFWTYFRTILSKAEPVGFCELEDPYATVPKGPTDANAFISKVIAISSINPVQPAVLAKDGGFDEDDVLAELFYATSIGLVTMRFAPECIQCGSAVMDTDLLGRVPNRAACAGCNAPNTIDSLDNIKVMFQLNSDVLYVLAENFACTPSAESMSHTKVFAAVPATSTGSGFSYSIGTGEESEVAPVLEPGQYRMHCPVAKTDNYLVVTRRSDDYEKPVTLRMKVSDLVCKNSMRKSKTVLTVPHGRIRFDVLPDTNSFFVLWIQDDEDEKTLLHLPNEERNIYTTASKVMHHPIFITLFQEQQVVAVPKDIFFSISNVVLVFTDIVDSTNLYSNLGDGVAFRLVRKHFQVLFSAFIKQGGRVVKTIGDAVMASFVTGRSALQGVADAMELLPSIGRRADSDQFLEIRVGVHCGKATVVPLNAINDYFGQTTNIAARVQSVAKASECFVTNAVLESSPDALECYREIVSPGSNFASTPATELRLKGVEQKVKARGFRWTQRQRHASRQRRSADDNSLNSSFNTFSDRREHTRVSFRALESDDLDQDNHHDIKLVDRPAESGRRCSNLESTKEHDEE